MYKPQKTDSNMKKGLLAIACVFALLVGVSNTAQAQMKAGVGVAFGTDAESLGLTGNFYTAIPSVENLSVGGDIIYFLPKERLPGIKSTWFEINFNGQYQFYAEQMISAYALGGLNVAQLGTKYDNSSTNNFNDTKIGLNLGVGGEYAFSEKMMGFAELKFVLSDADQAVFLAGLRFPLGGN
jgi:outer membrane protein X